MNGCREMNSGDARGEQSASPASCSGRPETKSLAVTRPPRLLSVVALVAVCYVNALVQTVGSSSSEEQRRTNRRARTNSPASNPRPATPLAKTLFPHSSSLILLLSAIRRTATAAGLQG